MFVFQSVVVVVCLLWFSVDANPIWSSILDCHQSFAISRLSILSLAILSRLPVLRLPSSQFPSHYFEPQTNLENSPNSPCDRHLRSINRIPNISKMAELPANNPPSTNDFEDENDDDLFASAVGVSYCFMGDCLAYRHLSAR